MEISRSATASEVQRCPFCHESVGEPDDQVACKRCLARHHRACWDEGQRCGACVAVDPLVAPSAVAAGDVIAPVPPVLDDPDERRREAARVLEQAAGFKGDRVFTYLALTPLTLGVFGVAAPAVALDRHVQRHERERAAMPAVAPDVAVRIEEALGRVVAHPNAIAALGSLLSVVVVISVCIGVANATDELANVLLAQTAIAGAYFAFLYLFRERVKWHEDAQAYAQLVRDAAGVEDVKKNLEARSKAWNRRRLVDLLVSLLGFVPFAGLAAVPLIAMRARGALDLHEKNEEDLRQVGRTGTGKGTP